MKYVKKRLSFMIIDCISDLHGHFPTLEGGDLLIIAGDLTARDTFPEYCKKFQQIAQANYKKKILVAGNHDNLLQTDDWFCKMTIDFTYLCDSGTEFEGLKIWGTPWTKTFPGMNPHCKAFTCDTEEQLNVKWSLIPRNTDILITHSPPFNFLDTTESGEMVGSTSLLDWIGTWKPRLHIFGHIHEAYGQERSFFGRRNFGNKYGVTMINASHVNERYQAVNAPVRFILEEKQEFQAVGNAKDSR